MTAPTPARRRPTTATRAPAPRRWLVLVHQLPSTPSNLRVRTWRRLQRLGALALKQAVYVLPDSPAAREDFEWLKVEITGAGGSASVFAAGSIDAWSDDALVEEFRGARQQAYGALARDIETALRRMTGRRRDRVRAGRAAGRLLEKFRQRFAAVEKVDFFGSAGRDRVAVLLQQLDQLQTAGSRHTSPDPAGGGVKAEAYRGRLWVTRPRPGVDRMASAWLVRRFIDPAARFDFVPDRETAPHDAVPFDMFGVEFSHAGDRCTFETLSEGFGIHEAAVRRLAGIVHDLDLKDSRFGAPEAPTVAMMIEGLQLGYSDDAELLAQGIVLFEGLYRAIAHAARRAGPRPVAPKPRRGRRRTGARRR